MNRVPHGCFELAGGLCEKQQKFDPPFLTTCASLKASVVAATSARHFLVVTMMVPHVDRTADLSLLALEDRQKQTRKRVRMGGGEVGSWWAVGREDRWTQN